MTVLKASQVRELPAPPVAPGTGSGAVQKIYSGFFWNTKEILNIPKGTRGKQSRCSSRRTLGAELLQHCHFWGLWGALMGPMCCRNAKLCVGWEIYALDIGGISWLGADCFGLCLCSELLWLYWTETWGSSKAGDGSLSCVRSCWFNLTFWRVCSKNCL